MTGSLAMISRTLYEKRWFMAGWALAFGTMSSLVMFFFPSFSQGGGFDEVAKSIPEQLQGFIGDPAIFSSLDGFIALQVFDVRMSLILIIMSIVLASGLTVKEEESGDMRTTLASAMSRTRLVWTKYIAALLIITVLNMATIAGIYIGIIGIGESAPHTLLLQLGLLSTLFGLVSFTIPFAAGIATGSRAFTMTVGLTVALGSYLLSAFSKAVDWLEPWDVLSLIHYYDTAGIREGNFDFLNVWLYVLIILLALSVSLILFRNRDLR